MLQVVRLPIAQRVLHDVTLVIPSRLQPQHAIPRLLHPHPIVPWEVVPTPIHRQGQVLACHVLNTHTPGAGEARAFVGGGAVHAHVQEWCFWVCHDEEATTGSGEWVVGERGGQGG